MIKNRIYHYYAKKKLMNEEGKISVLSKTLVCQHLGYWNMVWEPFNKEDQLLVEQAQHHATPLGVN